MDATIDNEWRMLYANNPKIQAFAVLKDGAVVWVTENFHGLVDSAADLTEAPISTKERIEINSVVYRRVISSPETYVATANNSQGHLLMAQVEGRIWVVAWATPDSVPELAILDLSKTAIQLLHQL
ncbi:MAG: hypothetical protein ACXADO_03480 [Candidatus Thorarchaeota archaeon]|jgi:hypothetical protein